jgi:hypothetical protein
MERKQCWTPVVLDGGLTVASRRLKMKRENLVALKKGELQRARCLIVARKIRLPRSRAALEISGFRARRFARQLRARGPSVCAGLRSPKTMRKAECFQAPEGLRGAAGVEPWQGSRRPNTSSRSLMFTVHDWLFMREYRRSIVAGMDLLVRLLASSGCLEHA